MAAIPATMEAPASATKPRTEDVIRQVREDVSSIRQKLDIPPILTLTSILKIQKGTIDLRKEGGRDYPSYPYEMAHRFIVDHIVASLGEKMGLTGREAQLVSDASGRLYHNAPSREYRVAAAAADELGKMGQRGQQIFDGWKEDYADLATVVNLSRDSRLPYLSDMFTNTVRSSYTLCKSFSELAKKRREYADKIDMGDPSFDNVSYS